jgi:hypothetical protein
MTAKHFGLVFFASWIAIAAVAGADTFRVVPLDELDFGDAKKEATTALKERLSRDDGWWMTSVRCGSEAYLGVIPPAKDQWWNISQEDFRLALRLKDESPVSGFVDLQTSSGQIRGFAFKLDLAKAPPAEESAFAEMRRTHCERLANHHLPGTAWFRHLAGSNNLSEGWRSQQPTPTAADSFAFLSGGRAVAENLALDRDLILLPSQATDKPVPISEMEGITVKAIDWTDKIPAGAEIAIDPLAAAIPLDQHALFAPSLDALFELMRVAETEGAPMMQGFSVRNPFRSAIDRYRKQMGLDMPEAVARLMPIKSVALTGGDPFFPSGTDTAILYESKHPGILHAAILNAVKAKAAVAGAAAVKADLAGVECEGFASPDRLFSAFVMRLQNGVAVANSAAQIKRLAAVASGTAPSLGGTDEFRFFRHRYPADGKESAFLFLSDETIRRWGGPEIRIGASRRNRAMAALMELTARMTENKPLGNEFQSLLGNTEIRNGRVWSETFGTLGFLTPVSELNLTTATQRETDAYSQWRRGYESGWTQVFDPIAVRLEVREGRRAFDLTVLPLTAGSEYSELMAIAGAARLSSRARAIPAGAPLFLSLAVDKDSELFRSFNTQLLNALPSIKINPLGWMGDSVSIWIEDDTLLTALTDISDIGDLLPMLPVCLRAECASPLKLALFLTALKSQMESSAPNLANWENRKHGEQGYVAIAAGESGMDHLSIYYAAMKSALLVALDEDVLKRAIERELAALPAGMDGKLPAGRHLLAEASPGPIETFQRVLGGRKSLSRRFQEESWKALPVLNEWHRRQPDADPMQFEREHFASEIVCPGGKGYQWNPQAMTMESVAYGHPAAPRDTAEAPAVLTKFANLAASFQFGDGGLRVAGNMGAPGANRLPASADAPPGERLGHAADFVVTDPSRKFIYQRNSPGDQKETLTLQTKEVKRDGDAIVYSVESLNGDKKSVSRFRLDADGVRYFGVASKETTFEFNDGSLQMPAELLAGSIHQHKTRGIWIDSEGRRQDCVIVNRIKIIGLEKVTTPGGVFDDCVRLESLTIYQAEGLLAPPAPITHWYHPKIGLVKSEARFRGTVYTQEFAEESKAGP